MPTDSPDSARSYVANFRAKTANTSEADPRSVDLGTRDNDAGIGGGFHMIVVILTTPVTLDLGSTDP
jgi:hypothetical protein